MAQIRRTADHSIWFNPKNYRHQTDDPLLSTLKGLSDGQQVELLFDGVSGTWERFRNGALALRPVDSAAKASWDATEHRIGEWFHLELKEATTHVRIPSAPTTRGTVPGFKQPKTAAPPAQIALTPTADHPSSTGTVLCVGLDPAWWGGRTDDPDSHNDALFSLIPGDEDSVPRLQRVPLGASPNLNPSPWAANFDPDAATILEAIEDVINRYSPSRVVLAVDAPLIAGPRSLPPRSKTPARGTLARRQSDNALAAAIQSGPVQWRQVCNIQPGAPVCPRIAALVDGLTARLGFRIYGHASSDMPDRLVIECFPGEAVWALGCLGYYGKITPDQVCQYKRFERGSHAWDEVATAVHQHLSGFVTSIGFPGHRVQRWIVEAAAALLTDPLLIDGNGTQLRVGKLLDDPVDAMNCLFTAVAFSHNLAHVWSGSEPCDGHIIGPGR